MKFEIQFGSSGSAGATRTVELEQEAHGWRILLDGRTVNVDITEIAPSVFSVLLDGTSHEIRITPSPDGKLTLQTIKHEFVASVLDPRAWKGRRQGGLEAEGRQQILAPMPGKVIRLLVKAGDTVEAGQGILVVEAMKMQNEIRSPKNGKVERVHAQEGQPVNAGEILAWID